MPPKPLGDGTRLVQAQDLVPWHATINPDPGTLAKVRAVLGCAILTPEIIHLGIDQPIVPGGCHNEDASSGGLKSIRLVL